mgnify:CR=1 FL=1
MRHERGWREKIAARTARRLQANLRRAAEAEGRSSMVWSPKENDAFFGEPQEDAREPGAHADDAETMCVWCETRVRGACKSHYDTLTCTHRVMVPTAEQWDSAVEARNGEPTHPAQWSAGYDAGFKDGHQAACEALQRDAERYRWLRLQDWDTCPLAVVANPKEAIKLGHDAPSRERLDAMIDAPLAEVRAAVNSALELAGRSDLGA